MNSQNLTELREEIIRTRRNVIQEEKAMIALNSTSLKREDLLELWQKVNSSLSDISEVREKLINMSKIAPPGDLPATMVLGAPPVSLDHLGLVAT